MTSPVHKQLSYRDEGPASGGALTILLVHGWGVSGALFEQQISGLSARFRVIVPDLPGHGGSQAWPPGAPFSYLADCLEQLVTELELRNICLVGWSLGALVAWDLLRRHPGIPVTGLVTIDMVPRLLNDSQWTHGLRAGSDRRVFDRMLELVRRDWPACVALFVPRIFATGDGERRQRLMAGATAIALRNDPRSMAEIWGLLVEQDLRADLAGIEVPALVVAGARSQLYRPSAAEWIADRMPRARLRVFDDSGHAPHLEQPDEFNRALADFADSLAALQVPSPVGDTGSGNDN
jgi:pimeloyl-[acyl-carrier protein] methyl ester esterase